MFFPGLISRSSVFPCPPLSPFSLFFSVLSSLPQTPILFCSSSSPLARVLISRSSAFPSSTLPSLLCSFQLTPVLPFNFLFSSYLSSPYLLSPLFQKLHFPSPYLSFPIHRPLTLPPLACPHPFTLAFPSPSFVPSPCLPHVCPTICHLPNSLFCSVFRALL